MKLTEKGKKLMKKKNRFLGLTDVESKLLILLDMKITSSPNRDYYGEAIKTMKAKGYIQ